jgi:hypothetical protein
MKKLLLMPLMFTITASAQPIAGDYLQTNNIRAHVSSTGDLFNMPDGFVAPASGSSKTMFAGNLWFGGYDNGGQLRLSAQTYRQTGTDFWPGPLDPTASYDTSFQTTMNKVWKISQCDIDAYSNWINGGTVGANPVNPAAMNVINSWPATDPYGVQMAPFEDFNANNTYEPWLGEVPKIKGDEAIYFIYNDKGGIQTTTGGSALGVQVQGMMYAYNCSDNPALYNSIFVHYKLINKSALTIDSMHVGNWTDFDIGDPYDDYVGCDVQRSMYFGYNGNSVDGVYGSTPPYQGVILLKGPYSDANLTDDNSVYPFNGLGYADGIPDNERLFMSSSGYYNNSFSVTGYPINDVDHYNYLTSQWQDGTPWQYGGNAHLSGGPATEYIYPGASDPMGYGTGGTAMPSWSESTAGNIPGDRVAHGTFGPFTMFPGEINEVEIAYVFAQAGSGGSSASHALLTSYADYLRANVDNDSMSCGCDGLTSITDQETENNLFSIFPNPSFEQVFVSLSESGSEYLLTISDVTGREISSQVIHNNESLNVTALSKGIYLFRISDGKNTQVKKFIRN